MFNTDASNAWFLSWPTLDLIRGSAVGDSPIAAEFCPFTDDESPDDPESYALLWYHFYDTAIGERTALEDAISEGRVVVRGIRVDADGNRTFAA